MSNQSQNKARNLAKSADSLVGDGAALISNKIMPVVGPVITKLIWKHKLTILVVLLTIVCYMAFALEALILTSSANSTARSLIPDDHNVCIQSASLSTGTDFSLIASYGKVVADFDTSHQGQGNSVGFLEISIEHWENFKVDGDSNGKITPADLCDNYSTFAAILTSIYGDIDTKIQNYPYSEKVKVRQWYSLFSGATETPYGNPISLDKKNQVTITSTYNKVRVIFGRRHVHKGMDIVPSGKWYAANPGKGSTDAVNHTIMSGTVTLFKDRYGALCSYVINDKYKLLYCHCNSFIAKNNTQVKYGDPICYMGSTGFSTGPHTHIALYRKNGNGWMAVDPTPFMFPN